MMSIRIVSKDEYNKIESKLINDEDLYLYEDDEKKILMFIPMKRIDQDTVVFKSVKYGDYHIMKRTDGSLRDKTNE